jgi:hypothetical protein
MGRSPGKKGEGRHTVQKAAQLMAIARKNSVPPTHRALYLRDQKRAERAAALAEAQERIRVVGTAAPTATPTTLSDWARWYAANREEWLALGPRGGPLWANQEELVPALVRHCSSACPAELGGGSGALLIENPGGGKTRTIFEVARRLAVERVQQGGERFGPGCPVLVLVPKTLLTQWAAEWRRFMGPALLALEMIPASPEGVREVLDMDLDRLYHCLDVVVMTYDTLTSAAARGVRTGLLGVEWRCLVVDEGTTLAHEETNLFAHCAALSTHSRIVVSAEPLTNSRTSEFNGLLSFLGNTMRLPLTLDDGGGNDEARALRSQLARYFFVYSTQDMAPRAMPGGRLLEPNREPMAEWIILRDDERRLYDQYAAGWEQCARDERLKRLTILRKLVISPALLLPMEARDPERRPSSKIESILHYLRYRLPPNQKALIFCDWQKALNELSYHLVRGGLPHTMMLASMTADERHDTVQAFGASSSSRAILITLRLAAGIDGLQQYANHVLFMSSWWQAKIEKQAFCRAERPGQPLPTFCTKFIVANSVDYYVLETNMRKEERTRELFAPLRGQ